MNLLLKFICIGCLLDSCSTKQSIKYLTDLEQANIKGHVAKLVTETYQVDSLGQAGRLQSITIEIFNTLGYTAIDTTKDLIENNEVVNFLTYNKNGSLHSLSTFTDGKKQSDMLLKYHNGKCIAMEIYNSNGKLESYYSNIQQNEFGLLTSLNSYDANGKLTMSYANKYDSIYQTRATANDSIGMLRSETSIQLTEKKYQESILEVSYFKDSTIKKYLSYKYDSWDSTGNWIRQTIFNDEGKAVKSVNRIFTYFQ
jgi:antitoxin component YwqK of YwqJK toxin-antitoxin module